MSLLVLDVFSTANEIAYGLVDAGRYACGREFAHTRQACDLQRVASRRVASIGLNALARWPRNRGPCNHIAVPAQGRKVAVQGEAAVPGFVTVEPESMSDFQNAPSGIRSIPALRPTCCARPPQRG